MVLMMIERDNIRLDHEIESFSFLFFMYVMRVKRKNFCDNVCLMRKVYVERVIKYIKEVKNISEKYIYILQWIGTSESMVL